jgi:starch-binding outer membrane protein, SusD/RagB family
MKSILSTTCLLLLLFVAPGCKKSFLQDGTMTEGAITDQQLWENDVYARGVLNNAYTQLPDEYNMDGNGAMMASACDEAVNSNLNSSINTPNNGTWSSVRTFDNVYSNMYAGLRKVNLFLENVDHAEILPTAELATMTNADTGRAAQVRRLKGEALFLRAEFHFELVKRYGGITLATRVFERDEELNLPRNTYQQCVNQIVADCDSAASMLPEWTDAWVTSLRGRATKTAAMALKSRMLLYAASPLNNPTNDIAKWQLAADAAKAFIDFNGTTRHALLSPYQNIFLFGTAPYNKEVIFATKANNRNDIEQNNAPISFDGALGRTNPTQELVDAFDMANGKPIDDPTSGYSAANPYANRDPRLALVINYNSRLFKNKTVDTYVGGKDGLGKNVNATKTGYYMRKFMNENVTWNVQTVTNSRRPWVLFRYAEILLNYAEALNEVQGPVADVYNNIKLIRQRAGFTATAAALPPGLTKDQMRAKIQNERRVEFCFEGHRFYDVRRWKLGMQFFNKPVSGIRITPNSNGTLSYTVFEVEKRVFDNKNYLYPFSQNDINRQPALIQNPGY